MAWYKAGSIAISGTRVTGTGTNWSDNKMGIGPGQALLIPAAGTVRMFEILRVDSATQLTLTSDAGSVAAGQTYAIMSFYTDSVPDFARRLSAQLSYYQSQMDGWQQIMTGSGSITLTDPNGMQITISSFKKLTDDMNNKASNGANTDITSLSGLTTALSLAQGGTGAKDVQGARTNLGISDKQLNSVDGKSGGTISSPVSVPALSIVTGVSGYSEFSFKFPGTLEILSYLFTENLGDMVFVTKQAARLGTEKYFALRNNGNMTTQGNITCVSLTQTSDAEKKDNIEAIDGALSKIERIRGVTYQMKDSGMPSAGVIAQELIEVLPEAVGSVFDDYDRYEDEISTDDDGNETVVKRQAHKRDDSKRSYTVEYSGVIALCVEAIKELKAKVDRLEAGHGS